MTELTEIDTSMGASADADANTPGSDIFAPRIWLILLAVYVALLVYTGYLAFLDGGDGSAYQRYSEVATISDHDAKAAVVKALEQEDQEHANRQDLATQSFNVVLGALLGFLSASATSVSRRKGPG